MKRKKIITIILSILGLGWIIFLTITSISKGVTTALISVTSLVGFLLICGMNIDMSEDRKEVKGKKWLDMSKEEKIIEVFGYISAPIIFYALLIAFQVLVTFFTKQDGLNEKIVYPILLVIAVLAIPTLIGMAIKKLVPKFAEKFSCV